MNLSFAGCGFLGIYHVGVAVAFKKYAPHLLLHRISGASAGALAACCLLCDMPLGEMTSDFFRVVNEARSHSLGPFSPRFNIQTCLLEGLQKFLPPDAHERVNGKLHISLTRVYDGKNVIVSQFNSREDLLQALLCACFIPVFSGLLPPRFHGVRYMDGAFSDNLPTLDENTVTVSPFCGESDICPRDNSSQMFHVNWANTSIELSKENINRFGRILFPPKPEILSSFCQQGFDDALNFLHRNNLISCTRCLAVQSTFVVAEQPSACLEEKILEEYDPECSECQECTQHRKNALVGSMPDNVLTVFQTYIEQANKGLINWVFRHRGGKLLTALSLPAILPADIVCATLTKLATLAVPDRMRFLAQLENRLAYRLMGAAPSIGKQIWAMSEFVLKNLNTILLRVRRRQKQQQQQLTANLQCQIALTEYNQSQQQQQLQQHHQHSHRSSIIDMRMEDGKPFGKEITPSYSSAGHHSAMGDLDTFDHILQVSSHHDAMYAYYYMDEDNKVKVTEIFDMSESDNPALQTANELEANQQLEFDTDWETTQPDFLYANSYGGDNIIDIEEFIDPSVFMSGNHHHLMSGNNNNNNNNNGTSGGPNTLSQYPINPWECSQVEIEELSADFNDPSLEPEADQQTSLMSESATLLLSKPPSSYSIEM
ncbi:1-acylglycerol-3-phosphate O-acyltransferase Pnpla3-like isoform X1 [Anopheles merus]|uniref:1-acylglycerol-3-phosphate O-acyltransferase Pnpla3-like isoform X1 n=1 Tax=Anopheles merus TaxID=30066 RepID=UPI001BE47F35|nr:1-acylglycerol-3-phosphate O-acyltransferase Pnpla3-like isoform X1 [Anopheles merus]XP_041785097.1 1-acylglycerol-3-phosphate O-acyltransferase Pnpla3-like isoform X1 [Anopheles merus]XP_041785098.1 1-acylglycerol-3-phosphate O-acyltransferase Pnpla3-like isoform X1 [Anopheles merus]